MNYGLHGFPGGGLRGLNTRANAVSVALAGSSVRFSVPRGAKIAIISFSSASLSAIGEFRLRLGDSKGSKASGYTGFYDNGTGGTSVTTNFTLATIDTAAAATYGGSAILTLVDPSANTWALNSTLGSTYTSVVYATRCIGSVSLSDSLSTIEVLASAGSFDAGSASAIFLR